jgi:anti-sigma factor ChrR (cupin superfamily)
MTASATAAHLPDESRATPNGSTYVDPEQLPWLPSQFDGITMKVLYRDDARGEMTVLLKWAPGASLPLHRHPEIEQSWVLEGSFHDHDGICRAGQFVWRKPGSMHETRSDEGCVILAIYRKPNIFRHSAGFVAQGVEA